MACQRRSPQIFKASLPIAALRLPPTEAAIVEALSGKAPAESGMQWKQPKKTVQLKPRKQRKRSCLCRRTPAQLGATIPAGDAETCSHILLYNNIPPHILHTQTQTQTNIPTNPAAGTPFCAPHKEPPLDALLIGASPNSSS